METKTTHKKGLDLEEKFAEYMKKELGYKATRVRANIHGSLNAKGKQIDIIAEKRNETQESLTFVFKFVGIIAIAAFLIGSAALFSEADNTFFINTGLTVAIICIIAYFLIPNFFEKEFALVECKNLKGKATIEQIHKLIDAKNDYKESGNKDYNFTKLIFVSVNGFIENAQKLATKKDVDCYEMNDKGEFLKSTYWK